MEERVAELERELRERGLVFPIRFYLSDEWFTPDGMPAIAIPFYLAHPRLEKLEETQMLEVEGGEHEWCMRILRHEAGHAIDNAYRLRLRRQRRELFGSPSEPYPEFYTPKPYSKSFVLHLDCLVRAEPSRRGLRRDVRRVADAEPQLAAALRRLAGAEEARVHGRADAVAARPRAAASRTERESTRCRAMRQTLRQHYRRKRRHYGVDHPAFYDRDLRRLFSDAPEFAGNIDGGAVHRPHPARRCASSSPSWTGIYQYTIDQVLEDMIARCRELKLRLAVPEDQARQEFTVLLTVQAMNYLHSGRHRVAL